MADNINVLVTGANGFIGKNLTVALKELNNVIIYPFTKEHSSIDLEMLLSKADIIYHLGGVNRIKENEKEFIEGNINLTKEIVDTLIRINRNPKIIMSSSTQATNSSPYGRSKKRAEEILQEYAQTTGNSNVFIYRLTNVFGKWGKPNYNSVVATFCYNISHNLNIEIHDPSKEIELVYIDDVVNTFRSHIYQNNSHNSESTYKVSPTYNISLQNLANKILQFHHSRNNLILPNFSDPLTKALYSTYLSFLDKDDFSYCLETRSDHRGSLTEVLKSKYLGQIFISTSYPEVIRGNHYHHTKVEKFCVIRGKARIRLRNLFSNEIVSYNVSHEKIQIVDIPPGYTHSLENVGEDELVVMFWANEIFDHSRPDTYYKEV